MKRKGIHPVRFARFMRLAEVDLLRYIFKIVCALLISFGREFTQRFPCWVSKELQSLARDLHCIRNWHRVKGSFCRRERLYDEVRAKTRGVYCINRPSFSIAEQEKNLSPPSIHQDVATGIVFDCLHIIDRSSNKMMTRKGQCLLGVGRN